MRNCTTEIEIKLQMEKTKGAYYINASENYALAISKHINTRDTNVLGTSTSNLKKAEFGRQFLTEIGLGGPLSSVSSSRST